MMAQRMQGGGGMPDPQTMARMMQDPAVQAQMRQLQAAWVGASCRPWAAAAVRGPTPARRGARGPEQRDRRRGGAAAGEQRERERRRHVRGGASGAAGARFAVRPFVSRGGGLPCGVRFLPRGVDDRLGGLALSKAHKIFMGD